MPEYDEHALAAAAQYLFANARANASDIKKELEKLGIDVGPHAPFSRIIPELIEKDWLKLVTPYDQALTKRMMAQAFNLESAKVTATSSLDDVAYHAALTIRDLVTEIAQRQQDVHVGFSGGNTTRRVFQRLVSLMAREAENYRFPTSSTLICHALVAGFDTEAPGTDPSSFFTYLDDCKSAFKKRFVLLHAPAFIPEALKDGILNLPSIKDAQIQAARLDLIVTSAASFEDRHSQLKRYYDANYPAIAVDLRKAGCVGDMLWLPISKDGPIDIRTYSHRPMTLLDLQELPARIRGRARVLLVLGPCADPVNPCTESKASILEALLNFQSNERQDKYVTDLVVDYGTGEEFLKRTAPEPRAEGAGV